LRENYVGARRDRWSVSFGQEESIDAGCSKRPSSKAAGSSATEAYPWGTLQGDERLRTKLAGFFSILLCFGFAVIKMPMLPVEPSMAEFVGENVAPSGHGQALA
jgi:hypothetical protein